MARTDARNLLVLLAALVAAVMLAAFVPHTRSKAASADLSAPSIDLSKTEYEVYMNAEEGLTIRYTLDGSAPMITSSEYRVPFEAWPDKLHIDRLINTQPTSIQWRHPMGDFPYGISVRAAAFDAKGRRGAVATRSWVPKHGKLPVFSLTLPPGALFDPDSGIYVVGNAFFHTEETSVRRFPEDQKWWKYPGNFLFRGEEWERSAHVEAFDPQGERVLNTEVHLRINGNNTRGFAQHALRLTFPKKLKTPLFGAEHGKGHRRILLRSSGNDQDRVFFRDQLQHALCEGLPFETVAGDQCVLYINGAYWGVHNLRERMDERELARRYGIKPSRVTIIADRMELYRGDTADLKRFKRLLTMSEKWPADKPTFVDSLARHMDVDGFLSYMAAQIILGNYDWPDQNGKWWRYTGEPDTSRKGLDGRWHWIMGDSDLSFGLVTGAGYDMFAHVEQRNAPLARLYKACLRSPVLRDRFQAICTDLLDHQLSTERMVQMAQREVERIRGEMPQHIHRWRRPLSMAAWERNVNDLLTFAAERPEAVRAQLRKHFPER